MQEEVLSHVTCPVPERPALKTRGAGAPHRRPRPLGQLRRAERRYPTDAGASSGGAPQVHRLLDLDGGAGLFELLLGVLGLVLGDAFLDRLRGALDDVLGLLEAEPGERAHDLDDLDLLVAEGGED